MASCKWAPLQEAEGRHGWRFPHYSEAWRRLIPLVETSATLVGRELRVESAELVWMSIHMVRWRDYSRGVANAGSLTSTAAAAKGVP